jgi:phosphoglucomutase
MGVAVRIINWRNEVTERKSNRLVAGLVSGQNIFRPRYSKQGECESAGYIIKTFVTTDLQKAIAEKFGLRCVETLTGFKYNGAKLKNTRADSRAKLSRASEEETRRLRLEKSSFYIFGGEESYGYSAADFVRDKDGNAAVIMFCEVAAYAKSRGLTLDELLDQVFCEFGYFEERNHSVYFRGCDGAEKIRRLLISYDENPPRQVNG